MKLYRTMQMDSADGLPLVGIRRGMLGVRPTDPANTIAGRKFDVPAILDDDPVLPGQGKGLSVYSDLARTRPSKNEVTWFIESSILQTYHLVFEVDENDPEHFCIAPAIPMTLKDYQTALRLTRNHWQRL